MKFHTMQPLPLPCHLIPLRLKVFEKRAGLRGMRIFQYFEDSMQHWLLIFPLCFLKILRIRASGCHYARFHFCISLPIMVTVTQPIMAERMGCRLNIYIHFRGGFSSFPFSSSCWLSSSANSSKYSFKSYCPWLSNGSVASSVVTSYNPASCTSLLMSSTLFSTGSNPVKLCINSGRSLHHIPFKHFTDSSSQAVLLSLPLKISNEHQ